MKSVSSILIELGNQAIRGGLSYQTLNELLKENLILAARNQARVESNSSAVRVSWLSTSTGISRREVSRLLRGNSKAQQHAATPIAYRVLHAWESDPRFSLDGQPKTLPMDGENSLYSLSREITHDVHPKSILMELQRLQLIEFDKEDGSVTVRTDA